MLSIIVSPKCQLTSYRLSGLVDFEILQPEAEMAAQPSSRNTIFDVRFMGIPRARFSESTAASQVCSNLARGSKSRFHRLIAH